MFLLSAHLRIFYSKEKQGKFDSGATPERYYTLSIQPFFFFFFFFLGVRFCLFFFFFFLRILFCLLFFSFRQSFLQVPPIKRFTEQTFYKLFHAFWHHQHFLINLKTFVLNWCRMLMLWCYFVTCMLFIPLWRVGFKHLLEIE